MSSGVFQPLLPHRNINLSNANETKQKKTPIIRNLLIAISLLLVIGFAFYIKKHDKRSIIVQRLIDDGGYSSAAIEAVVTDLPNLIGDYDFNQFSGYLDATNDRKIHYWFVEAEESPETKPIFLWTNGGPGCSGIIGLLTENGPFWVYPDLQLRANEYSWNKEVSVLYIEQPYGVGFSVPAGGQSVSGDEEATTDIDAVLRSFVTTYPKYANNDLYISSESFGGHYMPLTALTILQNNENSDVYLNFKGFMVGNPYTDYYENLMGFVSALYGHGVIKSTVFDEWMTNCYGNTKALEGVYCEVLYIEAYYEAYDLNPYALDFSNCPLDEVLLTTNEEIDEETMYQLKSTINARSSMLHSLVKKNVDSLLDSYESNKEELIKYNMNQEKLLEIQEKANSALTQQKVIKLDYSVEELSDGTDWIACASYFMERYLNEDDVQTSLHVEKTGWAECNSQVFDNWPEKDWLNGMETVYHTLVEDYDIKILVYSGDDDSVCGIEGTMYWLSKMGWTEDPTHDWEKWTTEDQLSGFYTRFLKSDGNTAIHFHSVRSAGHMVPQTQPARSLKLLQKFLNELD